MSSSESAPEKCRGALYLPLRHKHRQAFARAAGFEKFRHRQLVAGLAAIAQNGDKLRRAFGQNDVAIEHHGVTREMRGFFRRYLDQISEMIADRALPVFIEGIGKPDRATVR